MDQAKEMVKKDNSLGSIRIADEVVSIIAGLAATEVEGIAGMCSVSNNMPWMIVQRRGACNLITADRILDALGYQLVIVKKEDDT